MNDSIRLLIHHTQSRRTMKPFLIFNLLTLVLSFSLLKPADSADTPADLQKQFQNPPAAYRPLQIIHGFDGFIASEYPGHPMNKAFLDRLFQNTTAPGEAGMPSLKDALRKSLSELKQSGLGGVVCNVGFRDYLRDENQWKLFDLALEVCKDLGLRVWIYDEEGYPSGSAGGLVLEKNPAFEAQELILDDQEKTKYRIRPAYEGTHASNNYHLARRYPNLLDADADRMFIALTHDAYARHCRSYFGSMIEAFFTDEPSMIACSLGQIPESARKTVPIHDPLDPTIQRVPSVPWVHDLPAQFQARYGYDVTTKISALFSGDSEAERKVRRDYWSLVSERLRERYFDAIEKWCRNQGVASSGHTLGEESLAQHPALNGNPLRNLLAMDIPGIDILSSNPSQVFGGYAITGTLATSAAYLKGVRRVMSETSDHSEQMNHHPVTLEEMCATAAWQFALGVTDLTLYYGRQNRSPQDYARYCDFVGRMGTLLTPAKRVVRVALYYPINDLWAWYRPTAEPLTPGTQPEMLRKISQSFTECCSQLLREGISFCWVDADHLAQAQIRGKQIAVGNALFDAVALPLTDQIPEPAQKQLQALQAAGGTWVTLTQPDWRKQLSAYKAANLTSEQPGCLSARFTRNHSDILVFVNTTSKPWKGTTLVVDAAKASWQRFMDGSITPLPSFKPKETNSIEIQLSPYEAVALILEK